MRRYRPSVVRPAVLVLAVVAAAASPSVAHGATDAGLATDTASTPVTSGCGTDAATAACGTAPASAAVLPDRCTTAAPTAPPPPAAAGGAGSGQTVVTFIVPARSLVQVDADGDPVRVSTNTTCPPASTDEVVVVDAGGDQVPVPVDVASPTWTGDWSLPGEWHPWPTG